MRALEDKVHLFPVGVAVEIEFPEVALIELQFEKFDDEQIFKEGTAHGTTLNRFRRGVAKQVCKKPRVREIDLRTLDRYLDAIRVVYNKTCKLPYKYSNCINRLEAGQSHQRFIGWLLLSKWPNNILDRKSTYYDALIDAGTTFCHVGMRENDSHYS